MARTVTLAVDSGVQGARHRRRRKDEVGSSSSVEMVLVIPVLVLTLGVCVAGFRLMQARSAAYDAASTSARAASLGRSAMDGAARSQRALAGRSLPCQGIHSLADTSALAAPAGTPGEVRVRLRCRVEWSDLTLPGVPGSVPIDVVAAAPIDRYVERS